MEHLHTERAILAVILKNPDKLVDLDLEGKIRLGAFKSPINRGLIKVAAELYNEGYSSLDRELLYNTALVKSVDLEGLTPQQLHSYIESLAKSDVTEANLNKYLEDLRDIHIKDEMQEVLEDTLRKLSQKGEELPAALILSDVQTALYELDAEKSGSNDPVDISKGIGDRIYQRLQNQTANLGVPTGIPMLDEIMLGFLPTKFYFFTARPGEGKSSMLTQCAAHAAYFAPYNRTNVLYLDTEIPTEEFEIRLIGHIAAVDTKKIQRGDWIANQVEAESVDYAIKLVEREGGIFHKYVPGYTLSNLVNTIRKYVYNYGVGLVILDYLKAHSNLDSEAARWERVGNVSKALKENAGVLYVPVVSALQQNKKGVGMSRVQSDAFADSDDPFKEADGVFALNEKTPDEVRKETINAGTHRVQVNKGRYFKTLYSGINLRFVDYCLRFFAAPIQNTTRKVEENHDKPYVEEGQPLPTISPEQIAPFEQPPTAR
jgi:replicative DNA helicase